MDILPTFPFALTLTDKLLIHLGNTVRLGLRKSHDGAPALTVLTEDLLARTVGAVGLVAGAVR